MMSLDNVHIPMRANRILSISQINGKLEIAILGEEFFVTDSYFEDLHDAVLPFDNIRDLKRIIDHIIDAEDNKWGYMLLGNTMDAQVGSILNT